VPESPRDAARAPSWSFLTNHALVLICLADDPVARMRDVAVRIGVTERAVQRIVHELAEGGYLTVTRSGRRNRYSVHRGRPLGQTLQAQCTAGQLIDLAARKGR
jgi:DNA-binding MarR family transcriptional regulator